MGSRDGVSERFVIGHSSVGVIKGLFARGDLPEPSSHE